MLFEFAREREDPPVRIIPRLDFPRLAELQGRNGIGKTLSIKLLELLTGHQPWERDNQAWGTLRQYLGPTSVTVSSLDGAEVIEWDLTPSAWPDEPPLDVAELFLPSESGTGIEARIDGKAAQVAQIRELLNVQRLVGDETLEDSVRVQIRQMESRAQQEVTIASGVSSDVRTVLIEAVETLEPVSGRVVRRIEQESTVLGEQYDRLVEERKYTREFGARLVTLENRSRALQRLVQLQGDQAADDLSTKLGTINDRIQAVTAERDARFDVAVADVQLRQRIQDARAEVERAETLLERAVDDARARAAEAQLDDEVLEPDAEAASCAHDATADEIRRLREEQAKQDAVPLVRHAATTVKRALDRVDPKSLLDRPFAILHERGVSGRELAGGIDAELHSLASATRDPSAEQLENALATASRRLGAIVELQRALARQRRHTSALRNRRADLQKLSGQALGDASKRYAELEQELAELEDERRELQGAHFRYAILLEEVPHGNDLDKARELLTRDLSAAGVVVTEDLPDTRAATETAIRDLDFRVREVEVALDETHRNLESARERRQLGLQAVEQTPLFRALQQRGVPVPEASSGEEMESAAEQVLRAVERVIAGLDSLRREADGVSGAFDYLEMADLEDHDVSRIDRVRRAAEQRIVDALNQPVLQRELFDQGMVDGYDHRRKTVSFRPGMSTSAVTRSLSAFSSGERVFAYTQMRLRAIAESEVSSRNQLVVLDEFGAFLETRRIRALEGLVRDELLGHGIDRILFVLPMTANQMANEEYVVLDRSAE